MNALIANDLRISQYLPKTSDDVWNELAKFNEDLNYFSGTVNSGVDWKLPDPLIKAVQILKICRLEGNDELIQQLEEPLYKAEEIVSNERLRLNIDNLVYSTLMAQKDANAVQIYKKICLFDARGIDVVRRTWVQQNSADAAKSLSRMVESLKPQSVVYDWDYFGEMDFGHKMADCLVRDGMRFPVGAKVAVYSKHRIEEMRITIEKLNDLFPGCMVRVFHREWRDFITGEDKSVLALVEFLSGEDNV